MYGQELVKQLIVLGCPHLGVTSTNMSGQQYLKSLYMMSFQVCLCGWVGVGMWQGVIEAWRVSRLRRLF